MQRVLSIQMARGAGESSEFVTKRMCCSFLFSVGFLCLLCGFLLGRFAAERAMEFRAQRKRYELSGNGLESSEYLQHLLYQELLNTSLDFPSTWNNPDLMHRDMHLVNLTLSGSSLIHQVTKHDSCITGIVRGSRELDKYLIVSANGEGAKVIINLLTGLNKMKEEYFWKPRRSIVFCIFFGSVDVCPETMTAFMQRGVISYISVHDNNLQGDGQDIEVSGSDIMQSVVLQMRNVVSYNERILSSHNSTYNDYGSSATLLNIPQLGFSFVSGNKTDNNYNNEFRKISLAQIVGQTIWKLSECLIIRWDPSFFNQTVSTALETIENSDNSKAKATAQEIVDSLVSSVEDLNKKIDETDGSKILETRILNDLMMDLDRILLCHNTNLQYTTNWTIFLKLSHEPSNKTLSRVHELLKCYENGIKMLTGW